MQNSDSSAMQSRSNWASLLVLVGFVIIGMAAGNILAVVVVALYLGVPAGETTALLTQLINDPENVPNGWAAMMLLQGTVHFFSYLLPSLLYWYLIEKRTVAEFSQNRARTNEQVWLLVLILVIVFIPLNSQFIEWNSSMSFPEALSGLEKWMRAKEDQMGTITSFLTKYDRLDQLFMAMIVVVVFPALGEEMLFRGLIQRKLAAQWNNAHLGIWVAAAIFSAIHFQFYGFIPRMLLGALFGYLYYWTGSFWVAVFAHFVNNGFALVMMYLYHLGILHINLEESKQMPLSLVAASVVLSSVAVFLIRKESGRANVG